MPLSILVGHYPRVDLFRPSVDINRIAVFEAATEVLGKRYAVLTIARYLRRILFSVKGGGDPRRPPDKFVCSQLVSFAYRESGIDLDPNNPDEFTTPEALSRSAMLTFVGTLKV